MRNNAEMLLQMTLSSIYTGRGFSLGGVTLTPAQTFKSSGALPLLAARGAEVFRFVHPEPLVLTLCPSCGAEREGACAPECTKQGSTALQWPMFLAPSYSGDALLGIEAGLQGSQIELTIALLFLQDIVQEALARPGATPRVIPLDHLIPSLEQAVRPLLAATEISRPTS